MTATEFNESISRLTHQEPFQPFIVKKVDGSTIEITHPGVALSGEGGALFVTSDYSIVEFGCADVRAIQPRGPEAAA